jgi:hypothetical protein
MHIGPEIRHHLLHRAERIRRLGAQEKPMINLSTFIVVG